MNQGESFLDSVLRGILQGGETGARVWCLSVMQWFASTEWRRADLASFHLQRRRRVCTDGTEILFSWDGNRGGWYPREALKGEKPVAELVRVL